MIEVRVDGAWRVRLTAAFDVTASVHTVWGIICDVPRFVCTDLFHKSVDLSGAPRVGTRLTIEHSFLGVSTVRTGRILRWREGSGYAYSDLSMRTPLQGFPHVFFFDIATSANGTMGTTVTVRVNGRWTAMFLGRTVTRLWLAWNLLKIRYGVENAILQELVRREKKGTPGME